MLLIERHGAPSAEVIYLAVGEALLWWESCEDALFGLFKALSENRPEQIVSYGKATRNVRAQMLDKAIKLEHALFKHGEVSRLRAALEELHKLAIRRNEISHGQCQNCTCSINNQQSMVGHFLVPAVNELGPIERPTDMRFVLTDYDVRKFIADVRTHRGVIVGAWSVMMVRAQDARTRAAGGTISYGLGALTPEDTF